MYRCLIFSLMGFVFICSGAQAGTRQEATPATDQVSSYIQRLVFPEIRYVDYVMRLPIEKERQREIVEYLRKNHIADKYISTPKINAEGRLNLPNESSAYAFTITGDGEILLNKKKLKIAPDLSFEKIVSLIRQTATGNDSVAWKLILPPAAADSAETGLFASITGAAVNLYTKAKESLKCNLSNGMEGCSPEVIADYLADGHKLRELTCETGKVKSLTIIVVEDVINKFSFTYVNDGLKDLPSAVTYKRNNTLVCKSSFNSLGHVAKKVGSNTDVCFEEEYFALMQPEQTCCAMGTKCTSAFARALELRRPLIQSGSQQAIPKVN
jgi:hypothetical protein